MTWLCLKPFLFQALAGNSTHSSLACLTPAFFVLADDNEGLLPGQPACQTSRMGVPARQRLFVVTDYAAYLSGACYKFSIVLVRCRAFWFTLRDILRRILWFAWRLPNNTPTSWHSGSTTAPPAPPAWRLPVAYTAPAHHPATPHPHLPTPHTPTHPTPTPQPAPFTTPHALVYCRASSACACARTTPPPTPPRPTTAFSHGALRTPTLPRAPPRLLHHAARPAPCRPREHTAPHIPPLPGARAPQNSGTDSPATAYSLWKNVAVVALCCSIHLPEPGSTKFSSYRWWDGPGRAAWRPGWFHRTSPSFV